MDQTGNSEEEPDQDCMEDASTPQSLVGEGFQWCGWRRADGHYHATFRHPFDDRLWRLVRTAHFSWFQNILLKCTQFTLVPLSGQCSKSGPCASQKVSTSLFPLIVGFFTSS